MDILRALHDKLDALAGLPHRVEAAVKANFLVIQGLHIMASAQDDFKSELSGLKTAVSSLVDEVKSLRAAKDAPADTSATDAEFSDAKAQIADLKAQIEALLEPSKATGTAEIDPNVDLSAINLTQTSATGAIAS